MSAAHRLSVLSSQCGDRGMGRSAGASGKGKVCLVTFVGEFFGLEIAELLAAEPGWTVVCHAPDAAKVKGIVDGLQRSNVHSCGGTTLEALEYCVSSLGRIDAVVSSDPFPAHKRPILTTAKPSDMRDALEALTVAPYELACAAAREMVKQKSGGRIVFVTSAAPFRGLANYSPYCASRGATNALAKALAIELAPHRITVNAVAPNFIQSEAYFPKKVISDPKNYKKITANIPLKRLGEKKEGASAVKYLLSDDAGFITGHVMPVCGGWA